MRLQFSPRGKLHLHIYFNPREIYCLHANRSMFTRILTICTSILTKLNNHFASRRLCIELCIASKLSDFPVLSIKIFCEFHSFEITRPHSEYRIQKRKQVLLKKKGQTIFYYLYVFKRRYIKPESENSYDWKNARALGRW